MNHLYLLSRRLSDFLPSSLWLRLQRPIVFLSFRLPDWWKPEVLNSASKYLEIGPGKSLSLAIRLWLNEKTVTVWDLYPWLTFREIKRQFSLAMDVDDVSMQRKNELEVWLNQQDSRELEGFEYLTGWDTLQKLQDCSVDCVYSARVLEHVPIGQIKELMVEIHRVTRINGLGFHLIDHSFHGTHGKTTGVSVGHLTYSASWWNLFQSQRLYHENRLRACDYRQYFTGVGFDIRYFREWINPDSLEAIRQKKLIVAPEFRHYSIKDLCIDQSLWLVRKMGHVDSIEG